MALAQILQRAPVRSIQEAVATMQAIDDTLPDADGVTWFNRLYLRVTVSVGSAVGGTQFRDAAFLDTLDVVFANLYFRSPTMRARWTSTAVNDIRDRFFSRLDSPVGLAGRGLLIPRNPLSHH